MAGIREQKKQQTRQAIQSAAVRLFSAKGFDATSMEEIAAEAGIGKATIYGYFPAKKEIFQHYCDERMSAAFARFREDRDLPLALVDQLVRFFMFKFSYVTENREFGRHLLREMIFPKETSEQSGQHDQRYFAILAEVFDSAVEKGEISPCNDRFLLAAHFFSLYLGLFAGWYNGYFSSLADVEENMRLLFLQALEGVKK
ncbi:MAG: TetR/AcrR family transcriptional regulator [Pelovirga sp.]